MAQIILNAVSSVLKHFKDSLYSWKGVINLEETHRRASK